MLDKMINNDQYEILTGLIDTDIYVKIEGCNLAGSIKLKTAIGLIDDAERRSLIRSETKLIESSSGNLGIALALVSAKKGYDFTCVVDPNTLSSSIKIIESLGAKIVIIDKRDENGGFLGSRISYIREQVASDRNILWLNQYANPAGPRFHYHATGKAIGERFPRLDFLFVGAGTTGTLGGCVRYFCEMRPETKVIAVDSHGSVTFGGRAFPRYIPGLGTSRRPEICDETGLYDIVVVPEVEAVRMCLWLARNRGLMLGGSTGSVLAAIRRFGHRISASDVVVAISPDNGDKYLETIYDPAWVESRFPEIAA